MINNSSKLPAYVPDEGVVLENGYPDWEKHLIMAQFRIETATPEGTFQAAVRVLDHFAEMGVNGLWINPIWRRSSECIKHGGNNGYGNFGIHMIEPTLTGEDTQEGSLRVVSRFVEEAHKRNIRIIFDAIVWGPCKESPLVREHLEFYEKPLRECWGGWAFDWNSRPLRDFYTEAAVHFILETGADGFRVDLAPDTSGYFFKEVVDACLAHGRKILVMAECESRHKGAFHLNEVDVGWGPMPIPWDRPEELETLKKEYGHHSEAFFRNNIVDCIRTGYRIGEYRMQQEGRGGDLRYYTFNLLNHDDHAPAVCGDRLKIAYQALFAPFIPLWWIGEEWNNPVNMLFEGGGNGNVMFFNKIDWDAMNEPENRAFYEDVKRYIGIRRDNSDVFEYFPIRTRDANIEKVVSRYDGWDNPLQAYARFIPGKAILIIPNREDETKTVTVTPEYNRIGLAGEGALKLTNLYSGETSETFGRPWSFTVSVRAHDVGVFLLERSELHS